MALTVFTNVLSLNAQRHLNQSGKALAKSLERLSSGLRINRAGDDAAGLAISETLRAQVRGLNQAVRNSNDGISLLSTAEGAISESTNILQRIRELAVQSASDTNSATNRASIQGEVKELLNELDRIATSVEFNGTKLLDGTFTSKKIHVGAFASQTVDIDLLSTRSSSLGQVATSTGTEVSTVVLAGTDLTIAGTAIGDAVNDGVSFSSQNTSAIAAANAINSVTAQTGVIADAGPSVFTGVATIDAADFANLDTTAGTLTINGVDLTAVNVLANDSDGSLRNAINAVSSSTGVKATLDANKLVLTAEDGRNIEVTTVGVDATVGLADLLGLAASGNLTSDITRGTVELTGDKAFSIDVKSANAAGFGGVAVATAGLDSTTQIATVNVGTQAGANRAIGQVDAALRQINAQRANIGAKTNRLESTVTSLQSISENLAASDSRIRDADFAAETAILTRNQILQQAGVAILSQANALPQLALSLLS